VSVTHPEKSPLQANRVKLTGEVALHPDNCAAEVQPSGAILSVISHHSRKE